MPPNSRWPLAVLFAAAVAVRLGAVAVLAGLATPPANGSDAAEYDAVARNLLDGNGYVGVSPDVKDEAGELRTHPTAYRPPTPVLFYAAVYAVAGHSYPAAHAADAVLGGLTVLLVWGIGRRTFGPSAGWVAGVAYALYPPAVYYSLTLLSETQAAFLVALFAWLCLRVKDPRGGRWAAAAGLTLGVLLLCKPGFLFLFPVLPAWAWAVAGRDRRVWARAALIPLAAGLVVLPWAARNYLALGAPIPFGTGGGSLLLQANNRLVVADPVFHGYAVWDTSLPEYAPALREPNDEVRRDAVAKAFALDWLKANPDKWFYLARGKVWRLFTPGYFGTGDRGRAAVNSLGYGAVLVGFLLGVGPATVWMLRRRDPALILPALILATVGVAVVFHGQHRYRYPVDGLMLVVAAGTAVWLVRLAAGRERRPRVSARWAVAGVAAAGLAGGWVLAVRADNARIDAWRAGISRDREAAVAAAAAAYRDRTGRLPDRVADLVPEYLPNAEAVHAPTHTLAYHEYQLLGSADPAAAARVASYAVGPDPAAPGGVRVVRVKGGPPAGLE